MSDEEKKAIEILIEIREFANLSSYKDTKISQLNAIDMVLNLIEKQSKEIEDNKKYIDLHYVPYEQYVSITNGIDKKWKDKIKAKIEEYKELLYSYEKDLKEKLHYVDKESMNCIIAQIQVLQSLLEKE